SMSTATISFGLVTVPIRLYAASESQSAVSFNLLHDKCNSRLRQQYICTKDDEVVTRDQMVKGFEFAKDQYVVFTDEEIKAMAEEASKTIEITEFVPLAKVDPIYFEGAYYLGPDKGGEKAYRLLAEAMRQTGRCALAKWAARGKQYLVLMRPIEGGLVMQVLHYADEVRPFSEIPIGDSAVREPELKLAVQLIEQIATDEFKPDAYVDEVRARYHEAIERKKEGHEVAAAAPEAPKGQIIDLMEALKASLAQKGPRPAPVASSAPVAATVTSVADRKPSKRAAARPAEARALPKAAAGGKRR
ncbi:MAG TPA: Ku protein, partial [Vicinamibacteria bacterium]|nr:Ku protein [Vicinamibacteria bacterium]